MLVTTIRLKITQVLRHVGTHALFFTLGLDGGRLMRPRNDAAGIDIQRPNVMHADGSSPCFVIAARRSCLSAVRFPRANSLVKGFDIQPVDRIL